MGVFLLEVLVLPMVLVLIRIRVFSGVVGWFELLGIVRIILKKRKKGIKDGETDDAYLEYCIVCRLVRKD